MAGDGHYGVEEMMKKKNSLIVLVMAVLILVAFAVLVVGLFAFLAGATSILIALVFGLLTVGIGVSVPIAIFLVMWAVAELFGD
jgi:uncharacterized membrane protein (DUF485 family)